jgi:hypothetical protein
MQASGSDKDKALAAEREAMAKQLADVQKTAAADKEALQKQLASVDAKCSLLQKDLQLALLSSNKSAQSRQLAAAFAARSTKIKLEETLSAIKASANSPLPLDGNGSSPRRTTVTSPSASSQRFPLAFSTPLNSQVQPDSDIDATVKKLTSRLDSLQHELEEKSELCHALERQLRDIDTKADRAANDIKVYQARIVELERANLELTLRSPTQGSRDQEELVRQLKSQDVCQKSSLRVNTLEARLRQERESHLALRGKMRVAVETMSSAKNSQQCSSALHVLLELLELPRSKPSGGVFADKENEIVSTANKPQQQQQQQHQLKQPEHNRAAPFATLLQSKRSPGALKPVSPMERRLLLSPTVLR